MDILLITPGCLDTYAYRFLKYSTNYIMCTVLFS